MLSNKNTKNANFLFIVDMLKDLLAQELITEKEYARAKKYYMKLTGADIVLLTDSIILKEVPASIPMLIRYIIISSLVQIAVEMVAFPSRCRQNRHCRRFGTAYRERGCTQQPEG